MLKDIANDVLPDIQMEEDYPSKNSDGKMPILDMKVWQDSQEGFILFQQYQKPMASKKILHAMSASLILVKGVSTPRKSCGGY